MTDAPHDPIAAREDLDRFRDDFGRALLRRSREQDAVRRAPGGRPRRRRRAAIGFAATAAAVVLVVTALPSPGDHEAPLLGASPAEAAVQQLRRSLQEGVLVREVETTLSSGRSVEHQTQEDWTDLATRRQHVRIATDGPGGDSEYWNPSAHERWTLGSRRAADGRAVVTHAVHDDAENASSSQSPAEEVDDLLERAQSGGLIVRRTTVTDGAKVLELEQRQRCFASADELSMVCADPHGPSRWPSGGPPALHPVTTFATWWLQEGDAPRILRYENGVVDHGSTERHVTYRSRYTRWDVLPATETTLRLVRVPDFPAKRFLVVQE